MEMSSDGADPSEIGHLELYNRSSTSHILTFHYIALLGCFTIHRPVRYHESYYGLWA
jgi:hypothetical protein